MPPRKKPTTRANRTKVETAEAFKDVVDSIPQKLTPAEVALKEDRKKQLKDSDTTKSILEAGQGQFLTAMASAKDHINKLFNGLEERVIDRIKEVQNVYEIAELYEQELIELHGKEVAASAIEDLVAEYDAKKVEAKKEFDQWTSNQQDETNRVLQERKREDEEYTYLTKQKRLTEDSARAKQLEDEKRNNTLRQADLELSWSRREKELKDREGEFQAYKSRVEAIPTEIDSAVQKANDALLARFSTEHKHTLEMTNAKFDAQITIRDNTVAAQAAQIDLLNQQIDKLSTRLAEAELRVSSIANEALKSASGSQALKEVQSLIQQQSNPNATKR